MKKITLIVITLIFTGVAIALALKYVAMEKEADQIKTITLNSTQKDIKNSDLVEGIIYLPNKNFDKLVKKDVEFQYTTDREKIVKTVFDELFSQMKGEGLISETPELLNCYFTGKDLYLNLSKNAVFLGNDTKTLYVLYALTNSITELGGVERIKFLIDNQEGKGILDAYYERNLKF